MSISRSTKKRLRAIDIYASEYSSIRSFTKTKSYLESLFPKAEVVVKLSPLRNLPTGKIDKLSHDLASARVKDISSPIHSFEPMSGEVDYESRALKGEAKLGGVVYDGRMFEDILMRHFFRKRSVETASIVYTDRLVSTFSRDDLRHHLRTVVCGFPSIISVPGVVEAPAKPREYYVAKQMLGPEGTGGLRSERLKTLMKGKFIDYGDPRSSLVLQGLALQAVVHHITLEEFCPNPQCRLFNAHWQEDLIRTQVDSPQFCAEHEALLSDLSRDPLIKW